MRSGSATESGVLFFLIACAIADGRLAAFKRSPRALLRRVTLCQSSRRLRQRSWRVFAGVIPEWSVDEERFQLPVVKVRICSGGLYPVAFMSRSL